MEAMDTDIHPAQRAAAERRIRVPGGTMGFLDVIQNLGLFTVILLLAVVLGLASPVFFTRINIETLFYDPTIIAAVGIGQAFVILVAGIDLSVGAVVALASVLCAGLPWTMGVPVCLSVPIALAVGALIGSVNGAAVTVFRLPPLIATLAMMSVARGAAFLYTGGQNLAPVPDIFIAVQGARIFGVPVISLCKLALAVVAHFVLSSTRFGREIDATGGNAVAARLAGIRTNRVITLAYVISGLSAAVGGLMITARLEAGAATAGMGIELTVISAVVIGGVSLFGGEGRIGGAMLGVLLLGLVQNAINLLNVPPNHDHVVTGVVIAFAAGLDVYRRRFVEASLRRRSVMARMEDGVRRR